MPAVHLTKLDHLAVIDVRGEDAAAFLQAQLCGDVLAIMPGQCRFTAWCDPKGRVIASFLLARLPAGFRMILRRDIASTALQKLRLYVLRSRVELADPGGETTVAGWHGASRGTAPPMSGITREWDCAGSDGVAACALPGTSGLRLLLSGTPSTLATIAAAPRQAEGWSNEDMQTGLAWIGAALSGEFLPQEIDLERLGGLSHTKGCFPGQEIIARVRSRGRLKRGLHRFTVDGDPPSVATPIVDAGGLTAGVVVAAERAGGVSRGLAVSDLERSGRDPLHLERADGLLLHFDARRPD